MPPDLKKLISARFLFTFAVEMQGILLGWRMYELTHNTFYLGMIGLAEAAPAIGLALYAGYVVDHSRPVRVFRAVLLGSLASGLILWMSQFPAFNLSPDRQVVALFFASMVTGAARAFSQPSMYAIMPRLIDRPQLHLVSARMTTVMQFARISGPAAGGYFLKWFGMAPSAALVCVILVAAFAFVWAIRTRIEPSSTVDASTSKFSEFFSGAAFVFRHPILLPALSLDMISVLFGGVTGLLPVFAQDILNVGADMALAR